MKKNRLAIIPIPHSIGIITSIIRCFIYPVSKFFSLVSISSIEYIMSGAHLKSPSGFASAFSAHTLSKIIVSAPCFVYFCYFFRSFTYSEY